MKLLVLAQTPPPLHGQSLMVRRLVDGLPDRGIALHHVNFLLSRSPAEIGRWQIAKLTRTLAGISAALVARFVHGCDTLYYVPAPPGKRGALYRDWLVMLLCRPFFSRVVLHWHAAGLTDWLEAGATRMEAAVTRVLLGRADLAIVLADLLRSDAERLCARRIAVVPNGVDDPGTPSVYAAAGPCRVFFLGQCSEAKGLFAAAAAVLEANLRSGSMPLTPAFVFTAAGSFEDEHAAERFRTLAAHHPSSLRHVGTVDGAEKERLFAQSHLLCFPTRYTAEALPLVILEALARDRPVIATRWRGIPDLVSPTVGILVSPGDDEALVQALLSLRGHPPAPGVCRAHFLENYTVELHLATLAKALRALD